MISLVKTGLEMDSETDFVEVENKIRERVQNATALPKEIDLATYTKNIEGKHLSDIITKYYFVGGLATIELIGNLSEHELSDLLIEMGLCGIDAGYDDIISLLNIIPGLPWSKKKAKEVTSYTPEQLSKLSERSYFNTVLAYVTGYYLEYEESRNERYEDLADSLASSVIAVYVSLYVPEYKTKRKMEHMYHVLSNDTESPTESYTMTAIESEEGLDVVLGLLDMVPGKNDKKRYFLLSIKDYEDAIARSPDFKIAPPFNTLDLHKLTDKELLEYIIEYDITYNCREQIIVEAIALNAQDLWALGREKLGRNKIEGDDDDIFSYGRPMSYYCFKYGDMVTHWNKENVKKNGGFIRIDHKGDEPLHYLNRTIVMDLISFLEELDEGLEDFRDLYENVRESLKYAGNSTKYPTFESKTDDKKESEMEEDYETVIVIDSDDEDKEEIEERGETSEVREENISKDILIDLYLKYMVDIHRFSNNLIDQEPSDLPYTIPEDVRELVDNAIEIFHENNKNPKYTTREVQDIEHFTHMQIDRRNREIRRKKEEGQERMEKEQEREIMEEIKALEEEENRKREDEKQREGLEETIEFIHEELFKIDPKITRRLENGKLRRIPPQIIISDLKKWGVEPVKEYLDNLELYLDHLSKQT